jgi:hypothetical protein
MLHRLQNERPQGRDDLWRGRKDPDDAVASHACYHRDVDLAHLHGGEPVGRPRLDSEPLQARA